MIIGPFSDGGVAPDDPPEDVVFTFVLSDGGDSIEESVNVDDPYVPYLAGVYLVNTADSDQDGYYESWDFEIDADVPFGGMAQTSISITDDEGNDWGTYGPFTFSGTLTSDNVNVGTFTREAVDPDNPPEDVIFTFVLSKGGDTGQKSVPVDEPVGPYFAGITTIDITDTDGDGSYEQWSFEIDVDVSSGGTASTSIQITDDEGNDWGSYGPFTFTGTGTTDNVTIGPFSALGVGPDAPPEDVVFTLVLSNGGDTAQETVPVDDPYQPSIAGISTVSITDDDGDGSYEQWSFDVDVDVPSGGTASTSISITDDEGNNWGSYGPYTFTGTGTSDNVTIGPFTNSGVDPDTPPEDVVFTFTLSNGGDTEQETVPVDDPYQPYIWGVTTVTTTDANSDGYYEEWSFEIDVDVPLSGTASTSIQITDDEGNDWGSYGPFTFTGSLTSDNVTIGPFTHFGVAPDAPPEDVVFTFTLSNGGDTAQETVPVDGPYIPYIEAVYYLNHTDADGDGYLEQWDFKVDVDVPYGGTAQTSITITDDEGNSWGPYGPFTFTGVSSSDFVVIGPFTHAMVDPDNPPEDVLFTFTLSNGGDTYQGLMQVDDPDQPHIFDVDTVSITDADSDGYYEQWSFEIDVDVSSGGTASTSIQITDDE
ncbi:hypothetical protein AMJ82_10480, partial [candidate division TA06 bacterium SM23_40]